MDITSLSMAMSQNSLSVAVSTSVMKIAMDSNVELSNQMTDMLSTMAVDPNVGTVLDARA